MARVVKVKGVQAILRNMKKAESDVASGVERGLKKAGFFLQRESQLVVPVDTGLLRKTAITRVHGSGFKTVVEVVYEGTNYGIFVHEDLEARHAPGKMAKFLERPAKTKAREIQAILAKEAGKL